MKMMGQETFLQKIKDLIASGCIIEAIVSLRETISEKCNINPSDTQLIKLEETIITIQSSFNDIETGEIDGTLTKHYIKEEKAKTVKALLKITSTLKKDLTPINSSKADKLPFSSVSKNQPSRTVQLTIDDDFESYSEKDQQNLLQAIKHLLNMDDDLNIKKIRKGSVKISLDIPKEKYALLLKRFRDGSLDQYNVVEIDGFLNKQPLAPPVKTIGSVHERELTVEEKLRQLYELQLIDSQLDKIWVLKGELPIEVSDLEDEIAGLQTRVSRLANTVEDMNKEMNRHQENIKNSEALIERYRRQMDIVKNNREFDALSKELELQRLEIALSEKKIRETNAKIDNKKKTLVAAKERLKQKGKNLTIKKIELGKIIKKTEEEEEKLAEKSDKAKEGVDVRLIKAYDKIRKAYRNGLAVVTLQRDSCGGCFNQIPPSIQLEIGLKNKIAACEHCGRILVDDNILSHSKKEEKKIR